MKALHSLAALAAAALIAPSAAHALAASSAPALFPLCWGASAGAGYIRSIPTASQIGIQNGAASLTDGFPPLTFQPVGAGGVPPFGQDMNGILNQATCNIRWYDNVGEPATWSSSFSSSIGGYPQGAIVQSATTAGKFWRSTADNNATNPDAGGAGWVVWPPAAGSTNQVQFNSGGVLAGSSGLTWNGSTLISTGFSGPLTGNVTGSLTGNATTATTASNANALGGVAASGYVQNNGGTYGINITGNAATATTASNANNLGGLGPAGYVQNNGGTYGINITGNAATATTASSATTVSGGLYVTRGALSISATSSACANYGHTYSATTIPVMTIQYGAGGTPNISNPPYVTNYGQTQFCAYNPSSFSLVISWVAVN